MINTEKLPKITLLDGGMGRELMRIGAPFRQPEWSALSLIEAPERVKEVHKAFSTAGSDILTTNNYAVVPFHLGDERFLLEGGKLTQLAGRLAQEVASESGGRVAGSIPPLFGSYRPDLFSPARAQRLFKIIIDSLRPSVDIWLAETLSSTEEAVEIAKALSGDRRPIWMSFTLLDDENYDEETPRLRSGQEVSRAVNTAVECGASAILFNCSQPEVMSPAILAAMDELTRLEVSRQIGVYANAFHPFIKDVQANASLQEVREDLDPVSYLAFVNNWISLGATIIGGCCGIGPEHIALLKKRLK